MKKLVMMLVVAAMAAPLMAGTITFTATPGPGTCTIGYTADFDIRGMALNVDTSINVETCVVDSFFDVFMDAAYIGEVFQYEEDVDGNPVPIAGADPTPIANQTGKGEISLPSNSFCISMGNLGGVSDGSDEIVLTALGAGTGTLAINPTRGGIVDVDVDGNPIDSNLPLAISFGGVGPAPCRDRLTAAEQAAYDVYVANGLDPACWCNQFQCIGDADDAATSRGYRVYTNDLTALTTATARSSG